MFHKNNSMRRIPEGHVISQDPEPGNKVKKDRKLRQLFQKEKKKFHQKKYQWKLIFLMNLKLKGTPQESYDFHVNDMNNNITVPVMSMRLLKMKRKRLN